jgi:hypothetical protein
MCAGVQSLQGTDTSYLLLGDRSPRERLVGELSGSLNTKNPVLSVEVASVQLRDTRHSQPTSS